MKNHTYTKEEIKHDQDHPVKIFKSFLYFKWTSGYVIWVYLLSKDKTFLKTLLTGNNLKMMKTAFFQKIFYHLIHLIFKLLTNEDIIRVL